MKRLLVVDDEAQLLLAVRINLSARGYDVTVAPDGTAGLAAAARRPPDLVVLDLGLPDMDGVQVINGLRGWTTVPILVLSGRTESWDKVEALDAGADDFVTKPFDMDELAARVRSLLRRAEPENATGPVVAVGNHLVDLAARTVKRAPEAPPEAPESVRLTRTEWAVLETLLRHPGPPGVQQAAAGARVGTGARAGEQLSPLLPRAPAAEAGAGAVAARGSC